MEAAIAAICFWEGGSLPPPIAATRQFTPLGYLLNKDIMVSCTYGTGRDADDRERRYPETLFSNQGGAFSILWIGR